MRGVLRGGSLIFEPRLSGDGPDDLVTLVMPERQSLKQAIDMSEYELGEANMEGRTVTRTTSWRLLGELAQVPRVSFPEDDIELPETFRPDYDAWLDQDHMRSRSGLYVDAARQMIEERGGRPVAEEALECGRCQHGGACRYCNGLGLTALYPTIRFINADTATQSDIVYDIATLIAGNPAVLSERIDFRQSDCG